MNILIFIISLLEMACFMLLGIELNDAYICKDEFVKELVSSIGFTILIIIMNFILFSIMEGR